MRIHLFVPCFVDHFAPEVAWASARILQRLGHEVIVPETQTCCGQPGFNSGYLEESVDVAKQWLGSFAEAEAVVGSSGSCVAFVREKFPVFFENTPHEVEANELANRTWELSSFLVDVLGVEDVGARLDGKATFHDGCHGMRDLGLGTQARRLLSKVEGLELVEMNRTDLCCGFGGSFSVKLPELSVSMADAKLREIQATGTELLISTEPTCLSQLITRAKRRGLKLRSIHLANVLDHDVDERRVERR
jgi:L-lactate dehydrogenase complex protein LldE